MVESGQNTLKSLALWQRNKSERPKKNELQNLCSTAELTRLYRVSCMVARKFPPDFHRNNPQRFLFGSHLGEGRFHDLGGPDVGVCEQVPIYPQRDGSGSVAQPAAYGQSRALAA